MPYARRHAPPAQPLTPLLPPLQDDTRLQRRDITRDGRAFDVRQPMR